MVNLHHVDLGGAGHPPLLILHGLLGSSRNWGTAGRDLTRDWHVFALDARNHGKSPHDAVMNYAVLAEDVAAWMQRQGLARATLMGHSMGGKTAMLLACRQPALVEKLIVVDIAPRDYRWAMHRMEFAAMNELDLASLQSRGEAETRFEAKVPTLGMRKFMATNLDRTEDGRWRWVINLPALTAALPQVESNSLQPGDRYEGPALFLTGEHSPYVIPKDHEAILRHFPAAKFSVVPNSGHNPHLDAREKFVEAVNAFR